MVWKILSALSIVCLGAACAFAYLNPKDTQAEREREAAAKSNIALAQKAKTDGDEALKDKQTKYAAIQKELETIKQDSEKMAAEAQEKEAAVALIKANLEQVTGQVSSVEKQINDLGDVEKLLASIDKLKKDQLEAEGGVANQAQRLALAQKEVEAVASQITGLRDAEARGRRGVVAPDFNARVAQYFPEWNFAILSKGNTGGVFANADLEVKRGRNVIAKLKVRNVEQHRSIADVVPGSLAKGDGIRPGDVVVAAANQSAAQPPPAPKAPDAAPGATPAAPGAAPATPAAAAPMSSDPFGAAPAPAPGAAPAPAAAPAMNDPFGAAPAPAPAPGAAPAPAAGTPAAPSTADPFAPAPKKP